jgi:prepilin-type N-terminal cleavage/methylation domain-containing protein
MHMSNIQKRGFTLIEMMVYMAVLVLVAGALIMTFLSFDTVIVRNQTERVLASEARTALEYMVQEIRQADAVDVGLSTFDTSPGVLMLTEGAGSTEFYVEDGFIKMNANGSEVGQLTSDAVVVESVVFNRYVGTRTDLVRITMTLSADSKVSSTERTF